MKKNKTKKFFGGREYIDPRGALAILRAKMNIMGLDFDFTPKTKIVPGPNVFKLTRFGGTFGTTPEHDLLKDGFLTTDGISEFNNGKGMNLVIEIVLTPNHLYKFNFPVA